MISVRKIQIIIQIITDGMLMLHNVRSGLKKKPLQAKYHCPFRQKPLRAKNHCPFRQKPLRAKKKPLSLHHLKRRPKQNQIVVPRLFHPHKRQDKMQTRLSTAEKITAE